MQEHASEKKFVDVERILRSKSPKLLKVPFLVSYLKRIIHQDAVNDFVKRNGHLFGTDFVHAIVKEFSKTVHASGKEHIPATGGCIVVSNHPLGGLDAMCVADEIAAIRKDVVYLVNDILMSLVNLRDIFIPVNVVGRTSMEALERIENVYASDKVICIFPAGLVSRRQRGKIKDLEWKKSFITKAKKHNKPIVPAYIDGRNSAFFYNLARMRKVLGIKANIEMLYLADELFRQKGKTISIIFGEPIAPSGFDRSRTDSEWAQAVKEHVYKIGTRGGSVPFKKI